MKQDTLYSNLRSECLQIAHCAISSVSSYKLVHQTLTCAITAGKSHESTSYADSNLEPSSGPSSSATNIATDPSNPTLPAVHLLVNGQSYVIRRNLYVAAFGKCVLGMVRALEELLGSHIVRGVAIIPTGTLSRLRATGKKCDLKILYCRSTRILVQ